MLELQKNLQPSTQLQLPSATAALLLQVPALSTAGQRTSYLHLARGIREAEKSWNSNMEAVSRRAGT